MKLLLLFLSFLIGIGVNAQTKPDYEHSLTKEGITFSWTTSADGLFIWGEVRAKTKGWVLVGFNDKPTLKKSLLLFGAARGSKSFSAEHWVKDLGDHQPVTNFPDQKNHLQSAKVWEQGDETVMQFSYRAKSQDFIHPTLEKGSTYHLTLAWSQADEFDHHSAVRTSVEWVYW